MLGRLTNEIWGIMKLGFVLVGAFVICFIPTWVFLLIRYLLNPQGFWENFAVFGAGVWILGAFQFAGLILFVGFIFAVFFKK